MNRVILPVSSVRAPTAVAVTCCSIIVTTSAAIRIPTLGRRIAAVRIVPGPHVNRWVARSVRERVAANTSGEGQVLRAVDGACQDLGRRYPVQPIPSGTPGSVASAEARECLSVRPYGLDPRRGRGRFGLMRPIRIGFLVAALVVLTAGTTLAGGGNSGAAHACQNGGYVDLVGSGGETFANTGECVSFAARGGTFMTEPEPETGIVV